MKNILMLFLFFATTVNAQDYAVKNIADSLLTNANAVKRDEELRVRINDIGSGEITHKWAITILNEKGDSYARYESGYDKFYRSPSISGTLYDANGKELRSIKKKDIIDRAVYDGITMATDSRMKLFNFFYKQYPYTVEFEETQELNGIFFLPEWQPVENEFFSVQKSKFIVETPNDYNLKYKEMNLTSPVKIEKQKKILYTWEVSNIKAIEDEPISPNIFDFTPTVAIAPAKFEIDKHEGSMESWNDLGKFFWQLNKDRDVLPENIRKDVHTLTDQQTNVYDKIRTLYEYMQNSTRYISIQIGLGGWQTLDAAFVSANKYGDCKALSNYMVALLKEAGIKANYLIINAGDGARKVKEDFPTPHFNHAIACVPLQKDTVWLECTNQTASAGFMGSFTGNRKALLIDENGGHLVNTPVYKAADNTARRKINASIDESGNLSAQINTYYTGIKQELPHELLHEVNKDEKEKYLNQSIGLETYSVDQSDYTEIKGILPAMSESLKLTAPNYASISGKRIFFQPNIINKINRKISTSGKRIYPVVIHNSYTDIDSIFIRIPSGYQVEMLPSDVQIKNKFGVYKLIYKVASNDIQVTRYFSQEAGSFPPSQYEDISSFYDKVYKEDRNKMVFVKKDS